MFQYLAIGTRFWGKDPERDLPRIGRFIEAAALLGKVFVAINTDEDKCDTLAFCRTHYPNVDAFAVAPWGKFVPALNAIVYKAACSGANRLLLASAEFPPQEDSIAALLRHVSDDTLVAGARFSEHEFHGGEMPGNGVTTPWNTFALWNLDLLAGIGFPLAGDAAFDSKQAGVEELAAIAVLQALHGVQGALAKLVSIPGFYQEWNMDGWDEKRRQVHENKIKSKISRPEAQLDRYRLATPVIQHLRAR